MLTFQSVYKSFKGVNESIHVVKNVDFEVDQGEFVAIIGPSGSGKSTLLGLAAGLDKPDNGQILLDGISLSELSEDQLANLRSSKIGFIFQNFQLLPNLTAIENIAVPLMVSSSLSEKEIFTKSRELLKSVHMEHRENHFPLQLSGGEEQRIAIARSYINDPKILFADEPTANLDSKNGEIVMELLQNLNKKKGSTLIVVTHDLTVARLADRILEMKDGELKESNLTNKSKSSISKKNHQTLSSHEQSKKLNKSSRKTTKQSQISKKSNIVKTENKSDKTSNKSDKISNKSDKTSNKLDKTSNKSDKTSKKLDKTRINSDKPNKEFAKNTHNSSNTGLKNNKPSKKSTVNSKQSLRSELK